MASRVRADGLLDELDAMGEQISRALGLRPAATSQFRGWVPPVDVWETGDELVIELDAPGCQPENLAAEVVDNQLVVSGERMQTRRGVAPLPLRALAGPLRSHLPRARRASTTPASRPSTSPACSGCACPSPRRPSRAASRSPTTAT